jgi:hypothetical protein
MCAGLTVANQSGRNILIDFRNISPSSSSISDYVISWKNPDLKATYGNSRDKNPTGLLLLLTRATYKVVAKLFPNFEYLPRNVLEVNEEKYFDFRTSLYLDSHYENLNFLELSRATGSELSISLRHTTPRFVSFQDFLEGSSVIQIGVHVRRGDFVNWQGGSHLLPLNYYRNAIEKATSGVGDYKLWIFTDASDSVEDILNLDQNSEKFSSVFELSDSEELLALSAMDKLIISRSTFSQWSAFISEGDVFSPKGSQRLKHWVEVPID